jgi:glycosyltransferase involved in cell wall biosynthesis
VSAPQSALDDVTVIIPIGRHGNRYWLKQALGSFPKGTKYLLMENDGELAAAKNAGVEAAGTEFVCFFDADDVALPRYLETMRAYAWNADVVYPTMVLADADLKPLGLHEAWPFCPHRLMDFNYVSGSSLARRTKVLEAGGFDPDLPVWEDWDLWVRMCRRGARFKPAPEARMVYRQHPSSRSFAEVDTVAIRKRIVGDPDPALDYRATFYNQATPATTYVRCQLPARYLPGMVRQDALVYEGPGTSYFPHHRGKAAVIQFPGDKTWALMGSVMQTAGLRVLVEVDDDYLTNPGKKILKRSGWALKIRDATSSRQGHRWIAEHADGVIVTTPWLADRYRKVNRNVYVCPNGVDPPDWPEPAKPEDGVFRILWAAALSHDEDVPLIARAFEWASRQKGVEVHVAGIDPKWSFRHWLVPWLHDLDAYRMLFQNYDVAVAPVRQTLYGMARSDLKALESAMGGCALILSDVPPYQSWRDGENCLKAADARGFYRAVRHLVEHRDEARQLGAAAREYVLRERTAEAQIDRWKEAIEG